MSDAHAGIRYAWLILIADLFIQKSHDLRSDFHFLPENVVFDAQKQDGSGQLIFAANWQFSFRAIHLCSLSAPLWPTQLF